VTTGPLTSMDSDKHHVENGSAQPEELEDHAGPSNMARLTVQMQFKPTAANPLSENLVSITLTCTPRKLENYVYPSIKRNI
jgi:hypothetical protein